MEGGQADAEEQPEVGQPPADDPDASVSPWTSWLDARQPALNLAHAEVEEALGDMPVGRRQGAPRDRVHPSASSGAVADERVGIVGVDLAGALEDRVPSRATRSSDVTWPRAAR